MDFLRPFGENKRLKSRERASGRERGRKRAEEAEDNPPLEPAGCGANPASARPAWRGKQRGAGPPPGTGQAEPGAGGEGKNRPSPASHPGYFSPAAFLSPQKPIPSGKALSDTPFPPFNAPRIVSTSPFPEPRPVSGPGKVPGKPGSRETPCCEKKANFFLSFYMYRTEIVLLKTIQEQFGNVVNSLEVQSIFPTENKSRL